jgi:hypothetical protein
MKLEPKCTSAASDFVEGIKTSRTTGRGRSEVAGASAQERRLYAAISDLPLHRANEIVGISSLVARHCLQYQLSRVT